MSDKHSLSIYTLRTALKLVCRGEKSLNELSLHPLCNLKCVQIQKQRTEEKELGFCLKDILLSCIQELKPKAIQPNEAALSSRREWHSYIILEREYIKRDARDYVVNLLGYSHRGYDSQKMKALQELLAILQDLEAKAVRSIRTLSSLDVSVPITINLHLPNITDSQTYSANINFTSRNEGVLSSTLVKSLVQLSKAIEGHYSISELRSLCFEMAVEFEELGGTTKSDKVRELIEYLQRRGLLELLLQKVKQQRPNTVWPNTIAD